ncbi:MAG TPA: N-acetyltransferase [Aurantimonas coralicida]|uniref:N-acetyltransferase n=2 Tax=root TaxID=1 RepID=A0A9C9NCH3_9HYPH|nr:N-acetyltransferase [Aurantimonas coralicida]HET98779.1 N-acetyltransferase [Aurantimonas coralicida]
MISCATARTVLRLWEERDRSTFHRLNSDEEIMRFFPFRRDRTQSDAMMAALNQRYEEDGLTFFALEDRASGHAIGFLGLANVEKPMPMAPAIEIGWRLLPEFWGRGLVTEAASACLDLAFASPIDAAEIVSFCVDDNEKSEAVMLRLGFSRDADFDHPTVEAAAHPHLVRHRLYRLARHAWLHTPR